MNYLISNTAFEYSFSVKGCILFPAKNTSASCSVECSFNGSEKRVRQATSYAENGHELLSLIAGPAQNGHGKDYLAAAHPESGHEPHFEIAGALKNGHGNHHLIPAYLQSGHEVFNLTSAPVKNGHGKVYPVTERAPLLLSDH